MSKEQSTQNTDTEKKENITSSLPIREGQLKGRVEATDSRDGGGVPHNGTPKHGVKLGSSVGIWRSCRFSLG